MGRRLGIIWYRDRRVVNHRDWHSYCFKNKVILQKNVYYKFNKMFVTNNQKLRFWECVFVLEMSSNGEWNWRHVKVDEVVSKLKEKEKEQRKLIPMNVCASRYATFSFCIFKSPSSLHGNNIITRHFWNTAQP